MDQQQITTVEQAQSVLGKINAQIGAQHRQQAEAAAKGEAFDNSKIADLDAQRQRVVEVRNGLRQQANHVTEVARLRRKVDAAAATKSAGLRYVDAVKKAHKAADQLGRALASILTEISNIEQTGRQIDEVHLNADKTGLGRHHVEPRLSAMIGKAIRRHLPEGMTAFGDLRFANAGTPDAETADDWAEEVDRVDGLTTGIENTHAGRARKRLQELGEA
jgi:hypothetical protein